MTSFISKFLRVAHIVQSWFHVSSRFCFAYHLVFVSRIVYFSFRVISSLDRRVSLQCYGLQLYGRALPGFGEPGDNHVVAMYDTNLL